MNDFFRRTITGAGIVLFLLGGFWLHPVTFCITGLVIVICLLSEYYQIVRSAGLKPMTLPGVLTGVTMYVTATLVAAGILHSRWLLIMIPVFSILIIIQIYRKQEKPFNSLAHTIFPVIWAAIPFSLFPFTAFSHTGISTILPHNNLPFSPGLVIGFFLIVWANDTGAYLVGVSIGKHRLMERLSPKKSWEGFFGGTVMAGIVAWLSAEKLVTASQWQWITVSVLVSVTGTYGDLAESMFKRSMGVKDSGSVMPGHGGFLDRFDSTMMSFPFVFLFIVFFG